MFDMFRAATFLLALMAATTAVAQTPPPGPPFDPAKHPNPIVTFVETKDFKSLASGQAKAEAGIDLLGLSQDEGKRESLEIAEGHFVKNMSIVGFRTDVTFYPVVQQKFKLTDSGAEIVMYSFRFPKVPLPPNFTNIVLNEAAVEKRKKPAEMRFGGEKPETFGIRGAGALLFEKDGQTTVYWQEDGVGHTVTSNLPRKELFNIIEDLL
ncbi:MAG TPA: DUF4367 domain-containing protein [Terriglobia bacterium]|nr:DUF4367 domain-containing protein [Terriglobia bacterium]